MIVNFIFQQENKVTFLFPFSGWAMCQFLPTGEFVFLDAWDLDEILKTKHDADYGYFVEVDLRCAARLHEKLNEYPPAPSKTHAPLLSPFQRDIIKKNIQLQHPDWSDDRVEEEIERHKPSEKLIASLEDKTNYVCHYRLLQKYVELGMEVLISFISSFFLK